MVKFEFLGKLRDGDDDGDDGGSAPSPRQDDVPIDEVQQLSQQGYSQHEITEELRDRGYAYSAINKAMNRAVRDSTQSRSGQGGRGSSPQQAQQPAQQGGPGGFDDRSGDQGRSSQTPPGEKEPMGPQGGGQQSRQQTGQAQQDFGTQQQTQQGNQFGSGQGQQQTATQDYSDEEYPEETWDTDVGISQEQEELIETIIEEKIIDIEDEFETVYERLEELEDNVDELQQDVHDLKIRKDEDEREFLQKMEEMEDYLESSESRIGGLEKAFQQTLPSLVENVRDLTELVEDMRQEQ